MARKHNTKHHRSPSHYPDRLAARGESSASVRMLFIDARGRHFDTADDLARNGAKTRNEVEA